MSWLQKLSPKFLETDKPEIKFKGKKSEARNIELTREVLMVTELAEKILVFLEYEDLNSAYCAFKRFRKVINGSTKLRKKLFMLPETTQPASSNLGSILPIKIFTHLHDMSQHLVRRNSFPNNFFYFNDHTLCRLQKDKPSKLKILDRFITQPPYEIIRFSIQFDVDPYHSTERYVSKEGGITLKDLVDAVEQFKAEYLVELLEHCKTNNQRLAKKPSQVWGQFVRGRLARPQRQGWTWGQVW